MAFDLTGMLGSSENQVQQIPVERLVPYYKHPFQLYQGERLQDMVDSIQKNGILVPLVVRPCMGDYEILVGHNRWNAAKLAGLSAQLRQSSKAISQKKKRKCMSLNPTSCSEDSITSKSANRRQSLPCGGIRCSLRESETTSSENCRNWNSPAANRFHGGQGGQ